MSKTKDVESEKYREVAVLREPEGVIAVITERSTNEGLRHTYGFFKEFVKDASGKTQRTSFFGSKHLPAVLRLVPRIKDELEKLRTSRAETSKKEG